MSIKKKIMSVLTSAACLMCMIGVSGNVEETVDAATLSGLSSAEITSQMKIGWNLGNTFDATNANLKVNAAPEKFVTSWGNPVPTKELFETVQAGGFNTVRIPITWYQHLIYDEANDFYEIDQKWLDYVKENVDYAYELGMFIIINVHHEEWVNVAEFTDATYADAQNKLTDIWAQVAETFADYDQHLIFEGMNEPRQTGLGSSVEWGTGDNYSRKYINDLNAEFIKTVRGQGSAQNAERMLMLPGYCASSSAEAINAIEIPSGAGNVALSVHAYAPYFFTMDTSDKANHEFPGSSGWGESYEYHLDSLFNSLKGISSSKGAPIVIGEFSASDFENTDSRVAWAKYYLSRAKDAGIPCVLWDNNAEYNGTGEAHGYVYRATNTWYPNSKLVVAAMMDTLGITGYKLPDYAEYVKPVFSWDDVNIGSDWVELFRADEGKEIAAWKNFTISGWKDYVNENYKLVVVHDSDVAPTVIFQGGWYTVTANEEDSFLAYFDYNNITETLEANEVALADMKNMFVSATAQSATIYGVYAIPVAGSSVTLRGDVNADGLVDVADIVALMMFIADSEENPLGKTAMLNADCTGDGLINSMDCVLLRRALIGETKLG